MAEAESAGRTIPASFTGRANVVRLYLAKEQPPLKITTIREALSYGDAWQYQANRMEGALILATAQRDASDLLLRIAEDEVERLRQLLK